MAPAVGEEDAPDPHPGDEQRQVVGVDVVHGRDPTVGDRAGMGYADTYVRPHDPGDAMNVEDMILVSVDDHVVEPPDLFESHLPDEVDATTRRSSCARTTASTSGCTRAARSPTSGSTPSPGRPPEEYDIEPDGATTRSARGCYDIHERVRDMNLNGVLGSMCFPSFVQFCGQLFSQSKDHDMGLDHAAGLQRLAHRRVVRHLPRPLHPAVDPADLGPAADGRRGAARRAKKGCHAVTFSENPAKLGWPHIFGDHWDPFFAACAGRGHGHLPAHRIVVDDARARAGRADRRDDHAHAAQHDAGRHRPAVVAGAAQVPRTCSSRCRRAASAGSPTGSSGIDYVVPAAPLLDAPGLRRQAAEPGRARPLHVLLHQRPRRRRRPRHDRRRQHHVGVRLPALRLDAGRNSPEALAKQLDGVPDDEVDKITHENAMRIFQFDPFSHRPEGAVHGRRAARRSLRNRLEPLRRSCDPRVAGRSNGTRPRRRASARPVPRSTSMTTARPAPARR